MRNSCFLSVGAGDNRGGPSACAITALQNVKSRPAKVGDKLTTHNFYTGTDRVRCTGRCQHGGLRSSGNGARLCQAA